MADRQAKTIAFMEAACELIAGGDPDGAELVLWRAVEGLETTLPKPEEKATA